MDIAFRGYSDSRDVEEALSASPCFTQLAATVDVLRKSDCVKLGATHLTRPKEGLVTFDLSQLEWLSPSALVLASVGAVAAARLGKRVVLKVTSEDPSLRSTLQVLCRSFGVGPAFRRLAEMVPRLEPVAIEGETEQSFWLVNLGLQIIGPDELAPTLGALKQQKLQSELEALLGRGHWCLADADEIAETIAYEILDNAFAHAFREGEAKFAIACAYTRDTPPNISVEEYFDYRKARATDSDLDFYRYLEERYHQDGSRPSFFELAIGDPGWGVVATLAQAFWRDQEVPELHDEVASRWQLDRAVLEYAFLPWTSRRESFSTKAHAWLPRGLHRLRRAVLRQGGMVSLRSGCACVSFVPTQGSAEGKMQRNKTRLPCIPGTVVTVRLPVNRTERRPDWMPKGAEPKTAPPCRWYSATRGDLTRIKPRVTRNMLNEVEKSVRRYVFKNIHRGDDQDEVICVDISRRAMEPDLLKEIVGNLLDKQTSIESLVLFCDRSQAPTLLEFQDAAERRRAREIRAELAPGAQEESLLPNTLLPAVVVDDALRVIWVGATTEEQSALETLRGPSDIDGPFATAPLLARKPRASLVSFVRYSTLRVVSRERCRALLLDVLADPAEQHGVYEGYFVVPSGQYCRMFVHVPNVLADFQRRGWVVATLAIDLAEMMADQAIDPGDIVLFSSTHSMRPLVREVAQQLGLKKTPWHEGYFKAGAALPHEAAESKLIAWLTDVTNSGSQTVNVLAAIAQTSSKGAWLGTVVDLRKDATAWACNGKEVRSLCLAAFPTEVYSQLPRGWPRERLQYIDPVTLSLRPTPSGETLKHPMQGTIHILLAKRRILIARPVTREGRLNLYYINVQQLVACAPDRFVEAIVAETEELMNEGVRTRFFEGPVHLILSESGPRELLEPLVNKIAEAQTRCGVEPSVTRSYIRRLPTGIRFAHPIYQDFATFESIDEEPVFWGAPDLRDKNAIFVTDTFVEGSTLKYVFEEVIEHGGKALMAVAVISRLPYREEWFLRRAWQCRQGARLGVSCLGSMRIPPLGAESEPPFNRSIDRVIVELPDALAELCVAELKELKVRVQDVQDADSMEPTCYGEMKYADPQPLLEMVGEMERRSQLVNHKRHLRERLELLRTHVNYEDMSLETAVVRPELKDAVLLEILAEEPHLQLVVKRRYSHLLRERALELIQDSAAYLYQRACALLVLSSVRGFIPSCLLTVLNGVVDEDNLLVLAAALTGNELSHRPNLARDLQGPVAEFRRATLRGDLSRGSDTALLVLEGALAEARSRQTYEERRREDRATHDALQTLQQFYFDPEQTHMSNVWSVLGLARQLGEPSIPPDKLSAPLRAWQSLERKLCSEILPALHKIMPAITAARSDRIPVVSEVADDIMDPKAIIPAIAEIGSSLRELDERLKCKQERGLARIREKAATALSTLEAQILRLQPTHSKGRSHLARFLTLSQSDVCLAVLDARDTVTRLREPFDSLTVQFGPKSVDTATDEFSEDDYGSVLVFMDSQSLRCLFENLLDNIIGYAFSKNDPKRAAIRIDVDDGSPAVVITITDFGTQPIGPPGAGIAACKRRAEHWGGKMSDIVQFTGPIDGHQIELSLVKGFLPPSP